jgi:hydroxyacylglutathione hydrolase
VTIVDPGDADAVIFAMEQRQLTPVAILCTHHHWDHTGGNQELVARYQIPVYGPHGEKIPACTHPLKEGDTLALAGSGTTFQVLEVPGHTRGHIAYYGQELLFCGDALFSAGCGRLFEGTAEQMHASLTKLARLPDNTQVYCAHEYTQTNLRFALAVEPNNPALKRRLEKVLEQRSHGQPSLPSTLAVEKQTNPFLRCHVPEVRSAAERHAGGPLATDEAVFTVLRRWKDGFRG